MGKKIRRNAKAAKSNQRQRLSVFFITLAATSISAFIFWYVSLGSLSLPNPPLKYLSKVHNVDIGIHVDAKKLTDRIYPDIVTSQFEFVTIDGGAHFSEVHPTSTELDYSKSDKIISFAEAHNMPVQFHHLMWGDPVVIPNWLKNGKYSRQQVLDILHKHIVAIVKRYKGRVKEYTVVNEAFTESQHVYGLKNWWAEHIGDGGKYLDDYFIWAHQADPDAKLLINDFNNETKNGISDAMYRYIKDAKARGVPIDGIGMQLHVNALNPPDKDKMIQNMRRFGDIGVPVYITEFDINTNSVKGSFEYKRQLEADITRNMVRACIESKACASFNIFGITDKNDWIKKITRTNSRAYILDSRYRPKPAYYSLRQALLEH